MESLFNNKKGENMTIDQLIQEALKRLRTTTLMAVSMVAS
jgi:hypothetical protein